MGREQNTSPSRGSGYQVINDLFDRQQDFIVVGLCGKTGSGVSTTAEILNKEFEELHLNTEPPAAWTDYERHEYRLLYNYAKKNWNCFYLVKTRALITARVLGKTADAFTQFLCELVNVDKSGKAEESKNTIKQIVENELYNAKMTFEINTQFKRTEKDFPNTGIKTDEFFGIGENPLDDYDAILLNPKAEQEQRPIVDLTGLQENDCEVELPGAEEDSEPTNIHIMWKMQRQGASASQIMIFTACFTTISAAESAKRETSTRCITGYWKNISTTSCQSRQGNSGKK